jgi:heme A synthase
VVDRWSIHASQAARLGGSGHRPPGGHHVAVVVSDELPKADRAVRRIRDAAMAASACLLLMPSGLLLLFAAELSRTPESDTGNGASSATVSALVALGVFELVLCLPVIYLFTHARTVAGIVVTAVGVYAALFMICVR